MLRYIVCPSVRLSVTFRYHAHIGWNTSKIISRPNSLRLTPNVGYLVRREHPKTVRNRGGDISGDISERCKIGPRFDWYHVTLDDLERPKRTVAEKTFNGAHQKKILSKILSAAKCRPIILVSRNIRYTGYSRGFLEGGGGVKRQ